MILHQTTNSRGNYNYNAFIYTNRFWPSHFHGNYELIYVLEGQTEITVNGISDLLEKGELILLPPYTVHSLKIKNSRVWIGVFSEDFIVSFAKKYKFVRFSKFRCDQEIEETLKKHLFHTARPDHFLHISCLYMVCNECVKNAVIGESEQNQKFVYEVINYISENMGREIVLKDVADAMNYEYHYFSALFHQYFELNFKNFLNTFRVEKACSLLAEGENNVTSVAEFCGFGSTRNFNRVFKNHVGCTPSEYKNGLNKAE